MNRFYLIGFILSLPATKSPKPMVVKVTKEKYNPSTYVQPSWDINTKGGRTKCTSTPQRRNIAVQVN